MPGTLLTKIPRGAIVMMYTPELMALKWHDKKEVTMLSTVHDGATVKVMKYGKKKVIPLVIQDYNKSMGAVDQADQIYAFRVPDGAEKTEDLVQKTLPSSTQPGCPQFVRYS